MAQENSVRRLLLLSSSALHGCAPFEYAKEEIKNFLGSKVKEVLFIPYALKDYDGYVDKTRTRFKDVGLDQYKVVGIHEEPSPIKAVENAQAIFIGGGNTFRLLKTLYDTNLIKAIKKRVLQMFFECLRCNTGRDRENTSNHLAASNETKSKVYQCGLSKSGAELLILDGIPYMGSSAGTNVATISINTTNDMPIVHPPSLEALALVPFNINPHYIEPDPNSTHKGETRDERILEYCELETSHPVLGLKEGAFLLVEGNSAILGGKYGARLFEGCDKVTDIPPGSDVSYLLKSHQKPK